MTGKRMAGVSDRDQPGERAERQRRAHKAWTMAAIAAVGMVAGFAMGWREADNLFSGASEGWPPAMAIAIAASYLLAITIGGALLARQTDEVELMGQYKAVAAVALSYVVTYPVWFVLWMGNLAPEPMHAALFALFWLTLGATFLFYRFR